MVDFLAVAYISSDSQSIKVDIGRPATTPEDSLRTSPPRESYLALEQRDRAIAHSTQRGGPLAACGLLSWTTGPRTSKSLGPVGPGNYQKNLEARAKEIDYEDNDTRCGCHGSVSNNTATVCATTREEVEP